MTIAVYRGRKTKSTSTLFKYISICTTYSLCICVLMCVYMYLNCLTNSRGQI